MHITVDHSLSSHLSVGAATPCTHRDSSAPKTVRLCPAFAEEVNLRYFAKLAELRILNIGSSPLLSALGFEAAVSHTVMGFHPSPLPEIALH